MIRFPFSLIFSICYLLSSSLPTALSGQTPCEANYTRLVSEGDAFLKKGMYKDAFEKYRAARGCTEAVHQELDQKTAAVLHAVEGEREKADRNAILARRQQRKAEAALKQAEVEKARAEASERKANAVLNKIYFFEDRFGLAYDRDEKVYGYIDKNLDTKIDFKYVETMPFDYTGYAWVKKQVMGKQYDFLIDTFGNEYPLRYYVEEMDESTSALDLRNQDLEALPAALFQKTQLKVLFLGMNQLASLPPEIGQLKNLIFLGVSWNQLQGLPPEIGQLDKLKTLQLAGNQLRQLPPEINSLHNLRYLLVKGNLLDAEEVKRIKGMLPNCSVGI